MSYRRHLAPDRRVGREAGRSGRRLRPMCRRRPPHRGQQQGSHTRETRSTFLSSPPADLAPWPFGQIGAFLGPSAFAFLLRLTRGYGLGWVLCAVPALWLGVSLLRPRPTVGAGE